jgi:hypothetical protein
MLTKEPPQQDGPREGLGEKALDGAVTTPFTGPAGAPQHRDPPRHHEHGLRNPTALADGGRGHMGWEALEQCYNIAHRGAPLLWCVSCRLA